MIFKHGLRAALTPIITIFGMDLGLLLGGALLTEYTFSLHGLGLFTIEAVQNQDFPEIMGVVMLAAFFIVIANLVVDIVYAVARPEGAVLMAPLLRGPGPAHPLPDRRRPGQVRGRRSRSAWSAAARSASSASRARVRA